MAGSDLSALLAPTLLGLPVAGPAVVAAQRISAMLAGSLLNISLLGRALL